MCRLIALMLFAWPAAFASQQSIVLSGTSGSLTIPSGPPFNAMGSMRMEMRIHNMNPGPGSYNYIFGVIGPNGAGYGFMFQNGQLCITSADHTGGGIICLANQATIYPDVVVRYQRDLVNSLISFDAFDYQSGNLLTSQTLTMNQPQGNLALQSTGFFVRNSSVIADLAWIKWYSTLVPVGSPRPAQSVQADLGDWEFEDGSLNNQGTGEYAVSLSISSVSFVTTPTYPPTCNAGKPTSFRAGLPAQLDGTASMSGDESGLSYFWQQVSTAYANLPDIGLQRLRWSSHTVPGPTVTGLVFGPADFQLTVTQSDGQSSTCSVNDGAVATDGNSTVIVATRNSVLDNAIATLIGPMVQYGKNAWLFYDQSAYWAAINRIADMDVVGDFFDYWDVPGSGTVSVTTGSGLITGTGTHFTSDFCQGPNNPSVPQSSATLILWYQTGRVFGGVPETGRVKIWIGSCQSDTQMTMIDGRTAGQTCCGMTVWRGNGSSFPDQTGLALNYAITANNGTWDNNYSPGPANFYDNVQAYYALYYRSGIDIFLAAARKFADRFWTCPQVDRGMAYTYPGGTPFAGPGRGNSMSGLILRALDTGDGHPDMWAGLHLEFQYNDVAHLQSWAYYLNLYKQIGIVDPREWGYIEAETAYCALYDQDPSADAPGGITWQQYCRNAITNAFSSTPGTGVWPVSLDPALKGWVQFSNNRSSLGISANSSSDTTVHFYQSMVNLTNGSTTVSCVGTNCGFSPTDFLGYGASTELSPGNFTPCTMGASNPQCVPFPVLFYVGSPQPWSQPHDSTYTDGVAYCYPNPCTYVDANHFSLDRPYQGTTGPHGWIMGIWPKIASITVTNGGGGYSSSPTVTMTDSSGMGSEATAKATVSNGVITGITVTNGGYDYLSPVVTISDSTGSGASAVATIGAQGDSSNGNMAGFGVTTYMEGILGWAFWLSGKAMACGANGNPPSCSETIAAQANGYSVLAGELQLNYGIIPSPMAAASYFGGYPACSSPPTAANYICTHGEATVPAREIQADGYRGMAAAYSLESDPAMEAAMASAMDNWFAGMWAKNGIGTPPLNSPDGSWENGFDATGCAVNSAWQAPKATSIYTNCPAGQAYWITTSPSGQNKYFGQMFGISDMATWPVTRVGGILPVSEVILYVSGRISNVAGAARIQVTVTEPTGVVDPPVVCSASPCGVSVNQTIGNPMIQVSYLDRNGRVVSAGEPFPVDVN